jgi:hypothetical protein
MGLLLIEVGADPLLIVRRNAQSSVSEFELRDKMVTRKNAPGIMSAGYQRVSSDSKKYYLTRERIAFVMTWCQAFCSYIVEHGLH